LKTKAMVGVLQKVRFRQFPKCLFSVLLSHPISGGNITGLRHSTSLESFAFEPRTHSFSRSAGKITNKTIPLGAPADHTGLK